MATPSKASQIAAISAANEPTCRIPQILDALDITVSSIPNINLYIFELIQNALDAGASHVTLSATDDADGVRVDFEHNGPGGLGGDVRHIRGMSNLFQSTKSVASVGFMGFGFKTLYKRFQTVAVSDANGWTFAFHVPEREIQINATVAVHARDWGGAMLPTWDASVPAPTAPYTTRFILAQVTSSTKGISIDEDLINAFFTEEAHAAPVGHPPGLFASPDDDDIDPMEEDNAITPETSQGAAQQGGRGGGVDCEKVSSVLGILATQGLKQLRLLWKGIEHIYDLVVHSSSAVTVNHSARDLNAAASTLSTEIGRWRLYSVEFTPPPESMQALCQARLKNILAAQRGTNEVTPQSIDSIWAKINKTYKVVGLVSTASERRAAVGHLFATLPVNSRVPFGMAIQADWLLDLSRRGLRDLATNPWQKGLVLQIARLLASYVASVRQELAQASATTPAAKRELLRSLFDVVCVSSDWKSAGVFDLALDAKWTEAFASHLRAIECLPVITDDPYSIGWASPSQTVLLPTSHQFNSDGRNSLALPRFASHLLSHSIVDRECIAPPVVEFFKHCGLLKEMAINDLLQDWENNGLARWWAHATQFVTSPTEQFELMFEVWAFLCEIYADSRETKPSKIVAFAQAVDQSKPSDAELKCATLPCILTESGQWIRPTDVVVLFGDGIYAEVPGTGGPNSAEVYGQSAQIILGEAIPRPNQRLPYGCLTHLISLAGQWGSRHRRAFDWISKVWHKRDLTKHMDTCIEQAKKLPFVHKQLVEFTGWAVSQGLKKLITHVVATPRTPGAVRTLSAHAILPIHECVVGEGYVSTSSLALARATIFSNSPIIDARYAGILPKLSRDDWRKLFEECHALGPVVLKEILMEKLGVHPSYTEVKRTIAEKIGVAFEALTSVETTAKNGWRIFDTQFEHQDQWASKAAKETLGPHLAVWLETGVQEFFRREGGLFVKGEAWREYIGEGKPGSASWVRLLSEIPWVPHKTELFLSTPETISHNSIKLPEEMVTMLEKKGLKFGSAPSPSQSIASSYQSTSTSISFATVTDAVSFVKYFSVEGSSGGKNIREQIDALPHAFDVLAAHSSEARQQMVAVQRSVTILLPTASGPLVDSKRLIYVDDDRLLAILMQSGEYQRLFPGLMIAPACLGSTKEHRLVAAGIVRSRLLSQCIQVKRKLPETTLEPRSLFPNAAGPAVWEEALSKVVAIVSQKGTGAQMAAVAVKFALATVRTDLEWCAVNLGGSLNSTTVTTEDTVVLEFQTAEQNRAEGWVLWVAKSEALSREVASKVTSPWMRTSTTQAQAVVEGQIARIVELLIDTSQKPAGALDQALDSLKVLTSVLQLQ